MILLCLSFCVSQANEDVQEGITDEDYDLFYEIWQEFDPDGTQYMQYKNLSEFLDVLEPPLQIPKPNKFKIIHMDIPIVRYTSSTGEVKDNMVFCADILDALTQDFFARKGNPIEEPPHVDEIKVSQGKSLTQCLSAQDSLVITSFLRLIPSPPLQKNLFQSYKSEQVPKVPRRERVLQFFFFYFSQDNFATERPYDCIA